MIQTKHYSDTESESEPSDDGSKGGSVDGYDHEDQGEDLEVVPDDDHEAEEFLEEPVAHRLSEPPEDTSVSHQEVECFSYITGTEPARPVPAVVDLKPQRTEGEAPTRLFEGETMLTEGEASARVSDADALFFASEPTRTSQRRRCRDMSGLSQCLCGDTAKPNEEGSIQCQKVGCETVWVS